MIDTVLLKVVQKIKLFYYHFTNIQVCLDKLSRFLIEPINV